MNIYSFRTKDKATVIVAAKNLTEAENKIADSKYKDFEFVTTKLIYSDILC